MLTFLSSNFFEIFPIIFSMSSTTATTTSSSAFERTESIREEIAAFKAADSDDTTVDASVFAQAFFTGGGCDDLLTIDRFIILVEECLLEEGAEESLRRDRLVDVLVHTIYSDGDGGGNGGSLLQALLFNTINVDPINNSGSQNHSAQVRAINQNKALQARLISILVSLPELASNRLGTDHCPPKLTVNSYLRRLLSVLQGVLRLAHSRLSTLTGLALINLLIGRLCLKGHSSLVWECLFGGDLTRLLLLDDLKWLQIGRRVLLPEANNSLSALSSSTTTTSMFIESLTKMAFFNAPCHQLLASLFQPDCLQMAAGGQLLPKVHFLLTNKFLLVHYHSPAEYASHPSGGIHCHPDQFLWNILTYLAACQPAWMAEAVANLLDSWSSGSAFKSRPYYQHCYLARALVIAAKVLLESPAGLAVISGDQGQQQLFQHLQRATMASIELHLKSNQAEFRAVGFAAASLVMNAIARFNHLDIVAPDFETAKKGQPISNGESAYLKALGEVSVESMLAKKTAADYFDLPKSAAATAETTSKDSSKVQPQQKQKAAAQQEKPPTKPTEPLDSDDDDDDAENDDDLQPYDLSNDIAVEADLRFVGKDIESTQGAPADLQSQLLPDRSRQPPIYLQDLLEGLAQNEKPLWAERCLNAAEKIIRANFGNTEEENLLSSPSPLAYGRLHGAAHSLTRLLFHLDNQLAVRNFAKLRSQALAALAVGAPTIAAKYLAEQLYAPNLSLRQRMDVLAVLSAATGELTSSSSSPSKGKMITPVEERKSRALLGAEDADLIKKKRAKFVRKYLENDESEDSDDDEEAEDSSRQQDWRQVVAQRISANTRLTSPASLKSLAEQLQQQQSSKTSASTNAFIPVAGYFFFPLLHRGRDGSQLAEELGLRLAQDDAFLLEQLLYTLGYMVSSAAGHSLVMLMAKELVAFMAVYRGTELRNVRRAMILALEAVLHSTPAFYLFDEGGGGGLGVVLLTEWLHWLKEIALHDVDSDCTVAAAQTLRLLYRLKEAEEEKLLKSGNPQQQSILDTTATTHDLDTTIRILRQTNLK